MYYYNVIPLPFGELWMSKIIGEPVKVHENKDALPDAFIWRKCLYRVEEVVGWSYRQQFPNMQTTSLGRDLTYNLRLTATNSFNDQ